MHIAEGLLPLGHAVGWSVAAVSPLVMGARGLGDRERVRLGMVTALTFAVTLFPVPVPVVGMTSHMCVTPVLALLVGPGKVIVPTALVLLIQALFFAHGGLSTLGANVLTLGVVGPWAGWGVARGLRRAGVPGLAAVAVACAIADALVYVADAGILAWALSGQEGVATWFRRLLLALAPGQIPLALLEGVLSVALVRAVLRSGRWSVPAWLTDPVQAPAALAAGLVLLLALAGSACQQEYVGLDERVFAGAAASVGREGRPLLDIEGSELGRALFGGAMLAAGFVLGHGWARRAPRRREGPAPEGQGDAG